MTDFTVFDIETTGRTPWQAKLLRAGIGATSWQMPQARAKMHALLAAPGIIVEHTMFDARWALLDGAVLGPETQIHDTRVMAWLLEPEQKLDLGSLMARYLDEAAIVKPIVQRKGAPVWSCAVWPLQDRGPKDFVPLSEVGADVMDEYSGNDLDEEARLYERLRDLLRREALWDEVFLRTEVPLSRSIVEMEAAGLPFDGVACADLRAAVELEADGIEEELVALAGPVKLSSPTQLSRVLFAPRGERVELGASLAIDEDDLPLLQDVPKEDRARWFNEGGNLPERFEVVSVGRLYVKGHWVLEGMGLATAEHGFGSSKHWQEKTAAHKRPSTSSVSLVLSNPDSDWVARLVYWRELDKLAGSFLAKFPNYVDGGRLYGTVNRCGTVTGRFSSAQPNLQNIPAHGTYGAQVRSLFRGDLALGDYAQLEQRIATHYCMDPAMVKAYTEDVDLYGLAASVLFGGEPGKKHPQRGLMKTGMLGIQYGAGAGKLAQLIMIDDSAELEFNVTGSQVKTMVAGQVSDAQKERAGELIGQLRKVFPDFFSWRDEVVASAIRNGGVRTLSGRWRPLAFPEGWERRRRRARQWYSKEEQAAGFATERQAINTLCQGGAADVVGGAMTQVRLGMPDEVRTLVQVHDEMVWERLEGWGDDSLDKLVGLCERVEGYDLKIPLRFEAQLAETWADKGAAGQNAHGLFTDRMKRNRSEGLQSRKASDLGRTRQAARAAAQNDRAVGNGGAQPGRRAR